ncbi:MAG: lipocalin-like domain-containing protein [Bacteroides sp.]|nr:lipocalin-like domain-containing protein [Bacteroides sp.]MCM1413521.1 lipocalin-like domain-containing protein [Bacteroides sp.]MCM1471075.1 lipocalin-like domain-containing protein [Bacteroides sp.]
MIKKLQIAMAALMGCIMMMWLGSCRELAQNGDLSGQWQVTSIDYADGSTFDPDGTRYYCFYRKVAQLTAPGAELHTGNLVYDEDASTMSIEFPRDRPLDLTTWGIVVPETDQIDELGFTAHFTINELTSSRLVMTSNGTVIRCRKF